MASAKDQMVRIIQEQPDDSTYEEILRELELVRMIERGLDDSRSGRTMNNEEMLHRIRAGRR